MSCRTRHEEQNTRQKSEQSRQEAKEKQKAGKTGQKTKEEPDKGNEQRKQRPSDDHVADESHCIDEFCTYVHLDRSGGGRGGVRMAVAYAFATLVLAELQGLTSI